MPDGTVLRVEDMRIAFLGGIETEKRDPRSIDTKAYELLMDRGPSTSSSLMIRPTEWASDTEDRFPAPSSSRA